MRATIVDRGEQAAESLSLAAEAAAWQSKRGSRPVSIAGKVPVVHIRRRARAASWSGSSADRPTAPR